MDIINLEGFDSFYFSDEFIDDLDKVLSKSGARNQCVKRILRHFLQLDLIGSTRCKREFPKIFRRTKGEIKLDYIRIMDKTHNIRILYKADYDCNKYYFMLVCFQKKNDSDYEPNLLTALRRLNKIKAEMEDIKYNEEF